MSDLGFQDMPKRFSIDLRMFLVHVHDRKYLNVYLYDLYKYIYIYVYMIYIYDIYIYVYIYTYI